MIYEALCSFFKVSPKWTPTLPPPPVPQYGIFFETSVDDEDAIRLAIMNVYDITADDAALRKNVRAFDKLRAEYPVRREFFNTQLVLGSAAGTLPPKFAALGFKMG